MQKDSDFEIDVEGFQLFPGITQLNIDLYTPTCFVGECEVFITDLSKFEEIKAENYDNQMIYKMYRSRYIDMDIVDDEPYKSAYINLFALKPVYRKAGNGTRLFKMVLDYLQKKDLKEVVLQPMPVIYKDHPATLFPWDSIKNNYCQQLAQFYMKFGFTRMGIDGTPSRWMKLNATKKDEE